MIKALADFDYALTLIQMTLLQYANWIFNKIRMYRTILGVTVVVFAFNQMVGGTGLEPVTSAMSTLRSNQLS